MELRLELTLDANTQCVKNAQSHLVTFYGYLVRFTRYSIDFLLQVFMQLNLKLKIALKFEPKSKLTSEIKLRLPPEVMWKLMSHLKIEFEASQVRADA